MLKKIALVDGAAGLDRTADRVQQRLSNTAKDYVRRS
jgi:hypothetical protein